MDTQPTQQTPPAIMSMATIDFVLWMKIVIDALLGGALATLSALQVAHTANPTAAQTQDVMFSAILFAGLPTTIYTFKARIASGLPKLPNDPSVPGSSVQNPAIVQVVQPPNAQPIETHDSHPVEPVTPSQTETPAPDTTLNPGIS